MKAAIESGSRLSYGQQALWYLNQVEPASTAYHLGICLRLTGSLDEHALASAWADIGMAHPQLRARFILRDGQPSITIGSRPAPLRLETGGAAGVHRLWKETAGRPFALESEAPVRALLLRDANCPAHLLLCLHHIAGDLWSSAIILRELSAGYRARISGQAPAILREQTEYTEFAAAERRWLDGPQGLATWNFWREYLDGVNTEPVFTRGSVDGPCGEVGVVLGPSEALLIQSGARKRRTTPYAVLLAAYARLLGEETGRDELIVGSPAAIRTGAALRSTVGYLVNSVPVRCPAGSDTGDWVSAVAMNARRALERRRFPFPALVERLRVPRKLGVTPLFQSMFVYQSLPRADRELLPLALSTGGARWNFGGGIAAETIAMPPFDAQFPLALTLGREGEGFSGRLQYDGRCVTTAAATRMASRFPEFVGELLATRKATVSGVALNGVIERLENIFDDTARRMPNVIAVCERGLKLTYAQTKTCADTLAAGLDTALAGNAGPVGVQMPSCAEASILLLAILKSGRAFQPLDPTEPHARRNTALRRTGACALVAPSGVDLGVLPDGVVALTPENLKTLPPSATRLLLPSQTAYLVFTSGSTGQPKAVEVPHAAVINHARAAARIFDLTTRDRVLQFHTLAFDAAFEEIFPTWVAGACVVFEAHARELGAPAFLEMIAARGITVLNLPTSYWHTLTGETLRLGLQTSANLRLLVVGGEQASWKTYLAWRRLAPRCRWINTYGPTEATITALSYEPAANASARGILPIGRPIDGVTAVVLNDAGEQVPAGEGELLIGGKGLAIGYRGDPGMTSDKFVTRTVAGEARRLYRTGDRVKLRRDGNFEYLGRFDRQLKIRGYRVDPEEIEQALRAHPGITDAVVTAQEVQGELNLTGWIARANPEPTEREVRAYLSGRFPPHMIPSRLTFVAHIPRKPSGKVDTTALVRPCRSRAGRENSGPRELAVLFSELLGHEVGPQDDFFLSGGHSLLVIKLLGRVEASYGARVSVSDFFAAPTATGLWQRLQAAPSREAAVIEEPVPAETSVSAQQNRALLAHEIGHPSLGNIVLLLRVNGHLDTTALTRAVETVVRRNSLLRCGFLRTGAGVVLRETTDLPGVERRILRRRDLQRAIVDLAREEGSKPFALDGCRPWFKLLFASTGGRNSHLLVITHHAVADGWAFELLLDDLRAEYDRVHSGRGESVQAARDYRAYALEQARWLQSPAACEQTHFWRMRLSGAEEPRLPFRRPSTGTSWKVERREVTLPARLSRDLRRVAGTYGTTPFVLAMACFKALVHRYTGQRDILLGTVVSNRSAKADQSVRGPLQNPVLIHDSVTSDLPMRTLARRVARSLSEAEENGALPFEQVIRETQRPPSLDGGIQFLSRDGSSRTLQLGSSSLRPVELPVEESPFELSIAVSAAAPRLKITFEYRPTLYPSSGLEHLARQYAALLESVAATPHATVRKLNMTPANELRAFDRRVSAVHRPCLELLHQGFEAQARKNPDALAIAAAGRRLTYGELDSMSALTAGALIGGGLKPGGLVAVMLKKGWEQIVACLAVLKAGGTYVPVDPALPTTRLMSLFGQGKFHGAIVADATPRGNSWASCLRSMVTIHSPAPCGLAPGRIRAKPDSLAYIIFTSGSTGVPKGVMVSHQAAMTTIREINRRFRFDAGDRVLAVSALGFDLSVFDIFGTLRAGGTIVMPESHDPNEWIELVRSEKVTVWNSVPCLFELLLDEAAARSTPLETLRLILLSGDFVSPALACRARRMLLQSRFVALGGATEAAIWSIAHEVEGVDSAGRSIPYGRALRGQEMFVMDPMLNHCATGVTGELFIAGAGLAEGYWRNKTETKRRFVLHPRRHIRLYRTGDQGRYWENGEIEILGRLDAQVKINGVRVELGEVEAALCSVPSIRQAVAEVRVDGAGNRRLIAFVAGQPGTDASTLSAHMRKMLPAALTPAAYVLLDRMPLTSAGKVDRTAVRAMSVSPLARAAATPGNPTERAIAEIWSVLLGGVEVDIEQDFFALGGHSLLAIQMLQRVRSRFAVDLPLSFILEPPTVRGLATAVNAAVALAPKAGLPRRATKEFEHDSDPVMSKPMHRTQRVSNAVVLTGATGHLGSALLVELLKRTTDRIHCLIRSVSRQEAEARLLKVLQPHNIRAGLMRRVVAVPADLSRELVGLSPSAFASLAGDIRAAYHCAAEVNFIAPYEKLAASNVGGVREMIRLATAGGAILHYVSSVAVFPYGASRIVREDDDIAGVTTLTGGYAQSKWTSERMVWKAISRGLRAVIYRPAQIVGRHVDGQPHDLFHHILRACEILRAVPDINARIDMVTPEYAASAIRCLSAQESSLGKAFHLVHPEPVSLRDFVELFPTPPPLVPLEIWLARMRREAECSDDPSLHFISMLAQGLERADLTPPAFDCSNTIASLHGTGVMCPPLDRQFIQRSPARGGFP